MGRMTIEKDIVEHIREAKTPKAALETLSKLFSKKNEEQLQLLENELTCILQGTNISQYFTNMKNIFCQISQFDCEGKVREGRMKRIIIYGLRPEYNGFMATVRRWLKQPSLVELKNLLAN